MSEEDLASTTFSMTFVARGYTGESAADLPAHACPAVFRFEGPMLTG